jgi:hypothetical protein
MTKNEFAYVFGREPGRYVNGLVGGLRTVGPN